MYLPEQIEQFRQKTEQFLGKMALIFHLLKFLLIFQLQLNVLGKDVSPFGLKPGLRTAEDEDGDIKIGEEFNVTQCELSTEVIEDIKSYKNVVSQIFEATKTGFYKGRTYKDLEKFLDKFGSRVSGSVALEKAIDYMFKRMSTIPLTNLHTENSTVPKWSRGEEKAQMLLPWKKNLAVKMFGFSVPTPNEGVVADLIVINNAKTLADQTANENIKGKIVLFTNHSAELIEAPSLVARLGAVACIFRSRTPMSLNTPHIGVYFYGRDSSIPKVPVCAISPEDADLLSRIVNSGEHVQISLRLEVLEKSTTQSRNVIGDLTGTEKQDELVLLSGHTDSWDAGEGAIDDGIGIILTYEVLHLLKDLGFIPKRTIRSVLWTAEEFGLYGVRSWMSKHYKELNSYVSALESDYGCLKAMGYIFTGKPSVGCMLNEIRKTFPTSDFSRITRTKFMPTDIAYFGVGGVPTVVLDGNNGKYFWYHHTEADVLTTMNTNELDNCLAVWASTVYVLADMKQPLPRTI